MTNLENVICLNEYKNVQGHSDLTSSQRKRLVGELEKHTSIENVIEDFVIPRESKKLCRLLNEMCSTKKQQEILRKTDEIKKLIKKNINNYYDDEINDAISERNWMPFDRSEDIFEARQNRQWYGDFNARLNGYLD